MAAWGIIFWLSAVMLIILLNACFVAAEFSLVASRKSRIQELAEQNNSLAITVLKLQNNMENSVSGTQLGITLSSLGLGWIAEDYIQELISHLFKNVSFLHQFHFAAGIAFIVSFLFLSFMHVVLGEQVPKLLALRVPENTALWIAKPFSIYCKITYPFIFVLKKTALGILGLMGIKPQSAHHSALSSEEFEILFEASRKAGELNDRETDILKRTLELKDLTAKQVMIPAQYMDRVSIALSLPELLAVVSKTKHSKLPIFQGTVTNIVGILNCRDLFDFWHANANLANNNLPTKYQPFRLANFLRPAFVAPDNMPASQLLDELRNRKIQMAIIQNKQKATIGLVAMEDLLEHLVGEIYDEYDKVELWELDKTSKPT